MYTGNCNLSIVAHRSSVDFTGYLERLDQMEICVFSRSKLTQELTVIHTCYFMHYLTLDPPIV